MKKELHSIAGVGHYPSQMMHGESWNCKGSFATAPFSGGKISTCFNNIRDSQAFGNSVLGCPLFIFLVNLGMKTGQLVLKLKKKKRVWVPFLFGSVFNSLDFISWRPEYLVPQQYTKY